MVEFLQESKVRKERVVGDNMHCDKWPWEVEWITI